MVYAPYLETFQATPYDTVDANNVCFGEYCPKNYGGGEYGIVTLKTAMTYSYNTPAVRLLNETGIDTAFSYLEPFQWTHITQDDRYLSAALGAVNVTPLEITNAYTTFSHNGYYNQHTPFVKLLMQMVIYFSNGPNRQRVSGLCAPMII